MNLRRFTPARVAAAYAALGLALVLGSERLVAALLPANAVPGNLGGVVVVAVSAVVVYLVVRASRESLAESRRELEHANRQAAVLQRVLRHNVRNSVNVVLGYAEALADEADDPRREAFAGEIIDSADELVEVSRQARDLARLAEAAEADPEVVDVAAIARDCSRRLQRRYPGASVEVDLPESLRVKGHPGLCEGIENLVENGIEHNDAGTPSVRIELEGFDHDGVTLAVVDNGPGIPKTERAAIETATETDLVHSSGLGLWITRAAVDLSGGELWIEDRDGGTAVLVTLRTPPAELSPQLVELQLPYPRPA